jgi:hypothetical protein
MKGIRDMLAALERALDQNDLVPAVDAAFSRARRAGRI